jgi:hypothetical protein
MILHVHSTPNSWLQGCIKDLKKNCIGIFGTSYQLFWWYVFHDTLQKYCKCILVQQNTVLSHARLRTPPPPHACTHLFSVWHIPVTRSWACPAFQCGGNDGHRGWVYQASQHAIFLHTGAWIKRPLCIIQMYSVVQRGNRKFRQICFDMCFLVNLRCWYIIKWQLYHATIPVWSELQSYKWCIFKTHMCFMGHISLFQNFMR